MPQLSDDEFKLRRRWAKFSYCVIIAVLAFALGVVVWGDEKMAARLAAAGFIITAVLTFLTGLVGQYQQLVYHSDQKTKEVNKDEPT